MAIIRLTDASVTPGCLASVFCTRAWQAAQVIPVTGMRATTFVVILAPYITASTPYPAPRTASAMASAETCVSS